MSANTSPPVTARTLTNAVPMDVSIVDGSGNQVTAFGGSGGTSHGDDAAFTIGSASSITPIGALADEAAPDSVDEGDVGVVRMTLARGLHVNVRDDAGDSCMDGANNALNVNVVAGGTAGAQYTEGDTDATITGTAIMFESNTGTNALSVVNNSTPLPVADAGGSLTVDNAALSVTGGGVEATALRVTVASDSTGVLSVDDNAGSLTVDNAALSVTGGGLEATALRVTIASDSTGVLSVDDNGGALTVDGTVTANLAAGTNNIGDVDVLSIAAGTNYIGKVRLTDGTLDSSLVDETGASAVDALAVGGGTPHDAVDSGNPVKIGVKTASALPSATAAADRANAIGDLWGRQLISHIDPGMQTWKAYNTTSQQTGTDVWSPGSGKKIAVTTLMIGTYGTTGGRLILWFGDNADTTYSAGTDQVLFAGSYVPSATIKPGTIVHFNPPAFCTTADRELHITTDAALSVDVTVYGYEW